MGLDMYLESYKKTNDFGKELSLTDVLEIKEQFEYLENKETEEIISARNMFLCDNGLIENYNLRGTSFSWLSPFKEEFYWRKANAIHQWFVSIVQNGEDNCERYEVSKEQITELRDTCKQIMDDHSKAAELLPSRSGFFFGNTEYNEWYLKRIEKTYNILSDLITWKFNFKEYQLIYTSSW